MRKFSLFSVSFLLFLFFAASLFSQTVNIKIIETSDVHGAILPYDFINEKETDGSLAQVQSYVIRQKTPGNNVILLDNGDILQGDPTVYYYNYEDTTTTHILADAMNFMQYDAATVGNHDIETGHAVYDRFWNQIQFPWLAANAVNNETNEPYFTPYKIFEKEGVKIAVLGLITPAIPTWLPEILWKGMRFDDMIESAEKWVKIIKEKENPDLLVGLFHSGVEYEYNDQDEDTYKNENASALVAEKIPGFDIIFVGHDHTGWNYTIENGEGKDVLILGAKSKAKTIAVANIIMEMDSESNLWNKKSISGEIIETKDYKADDHFMSRYLLKMNVIENYVSQPIGQISKTISTKESLFGPSEFVDLIHSAQMEITGAEISFVSPLFFNATIDSGWIRTRDMFKLYRYENFLYTMDLSGKEIKNYLEYSFGKWFNEMKDENDHLLKFKLDDEGNIMVSENHRTPVLEGQYYNFSSAAGINYTVDVSKPIGGRVTISSLSDGSDFKMDEPYTVAVNSYRGNGGGGHLIRGSGIPQEELSSRVISSTDKDLRFYLMKWIGSKKNLTPKKLSNWKIIPEEWWNKGKGEDYFLMFGELPLKTAEVINKD